MGQIDRRRMSISASVTLGVGRGGWSSVRVIGTSADARISPARCADHQGAGLLRRADEASVALSRWWVFRRRDGENAAERANPRRSSGLTLASLAKQFDQGSDYYANVVTFAQRGRSP